MLGSSFLYIKSQDQLSAISLRNVASAVCISFSHKYILIIIRVESGVGGTLVARFMKMMDTFMKIIIGFASIFGFFVPLSIILP